MEITLNQSTKASIKEMYFQRPDLSAKDIAEFLSLNHSQVYAYMKQIGYTKQKHQKALEQRKLKLQEATKSKPVPTVKSFAQEVRSNKMYSPFLTEKKAEAKLHQQIDNAEKLMMQAAEEGNMDAFLQHRKDYDAAQRRLAAFKERGNLAAEDKLIYKAESQYQAVN